MVDPKIDIVIVNWNSGRFLSQCLDSLTAPRISARNPHRITVIDNASSDGSADNLRGATLIANPINRGFAAGCNQGAQAGSASLILFLNPDTALEPDALDQLVDFLARPERRRTGIVGPQLLDEQGAVQRRTARTPTPARLIAQSAGLDRIWPRRFPKHFVEEWDHLETRPVDQVMGACLLIRRTLFEDLGGFDERFFLYYEDVDLCLRARLAGWQVLHLAEARVRHAGGGTTRNIRARRLALNLRSRVQFIAKHHSRASALGVTLAALLLELPARLLRAGFRGSAAEANETLAGAVLFIGELPGLWRRLRSRSDTLDIAA